MENNNLFIDLEKLYFDATSETMFTTTKKMEAQIGAMLMPVFANLKYVSVTYNDGTDRIIPVDTPRNEFIVNLYFSPNPKGHSSVPGDGVSAPIENLERIGYSGNKKADNHNSLYNALMRATGSVSNRAQQYTINKDTREALAFFMFDERNINWRSHIFEVEDTSNYNSNGKFEYCVAVFGLSLGKFVDMLYGSFDSDGNPIDYRIDIVRNLVPSNLNTGRHYILGINRLSRRAVRELAEMTNTYRGGINFGTSVIR